MAIIGGAGNPVGGSFTGPAEALEVYGDFAAAYSGSQNVNTSDVQHLKFTSGNYLFVGELAFSGAVKFATGSVSGGKVSAAQISFNGVNLTNLKVDTTTDDSPAEIVYPILIPAYTEVEVNVVSNDTTAGYETSVNVIGKIYRE